VSELTHLGPDGAARMVDVSTKLGTSREALAEGWIRMSPATLALIRAGDAPKGDVLGTARIAGIQAGKRTGELIPLCHILPATSVQVDLELDPELPGVRVRATARVAGQTGVELEALTAVSVSLLTIYDMVKAADRGMEMGGIRLLKKEGGRSGSWSAE
jgi:cyclic pyranopterin phosphate synthase